METKSIITEILILPTKFYNPETNRPMYSLLQETGYFKVYDDVSEKAIKEALDRHPQYINQWLSWSADKRVGFGWYFLETENQKYEVGFLDIDKGTIEKMEYSDGKSACAAFIKHEIEGIRKS